MIELPIRDYKDNVVYAKRNGVAWAYYRVMESAVGLNENEAEDKLVHRLNRLAVQLSDYEEIDYRVIPVPIDIDRRMDELKKQFEGVYADIGHYYADRSKEILKEEAAEAVDYKFFVGVKLKRRDSEESMMGQVASSFKGLNRAIKKLAGAESQQIEDEIVKDYTESEEDAYSLLSGYFPLQRVSEQEMRYLIRRQYLRGQGQYTDEQTVYSLTEGILDPSAPGYLRIEQLQGESYCAFLPVVEFPIDLRYQEWAYFFQSYHFPVEMNIRTIYKGRRPDYNETNKIKKRFRDQDDQLVKANEDEDSMVNSGRVLLHELENDIKNTNKPLLRTHISFVVYGKSMEECKKRAKQLKSDFKDRSIQLAQPLADQLRLFHQAIPSAPVVADDWEQILTPESFAESLFSMTRKIGNTVGFYLGKNISLDGETVENSQFMVMFHPFLAALGLKGSKYSSPHTVISGPTGMGKSLLLKYITLYSVFFGAKVLMTDPKNEVEKKFKAALTPEMREQVPMFCELIESFNYITFSAELEDAGKLDPLTFLEGEEASDTAVAVLEYLAQLQPQERKVKTAIQKNVRMVMLEGKPGLLKVVQLLQQSEDREVSDVGDYLYEQATNGIAKLMFSDGNVKGISLKHRVNVLQIQNLSLPEEGEEAITRDQHVAVAIMIPLAKFATKFARDDRETKLTIFEEAWMLSSTGQGSKLIKEMLRTGRSLRSAVFIISQSTLDYNSPDIKEQIGTKFSFKAKTVEEADNIIEFLSLENNTANREVLRNLTEGQCIMEDIYGRTAKIQIDVLFDEWLQAFNTKEADRGRAKAEEAFI